jgi:hypothetical protein
MFTGQVHSRVLMLAALLASAVSAQIGGTGSIDGTVSDPSGAGVPGATVTATNVATNVKTVQQTTAAGLYTISALPPGEYTVTITATGFQPVTQQHVIVDALAVVTVNLPLKVGTVGETITVTAAPPQLNTADSTLGGNMRNELYTALPLAMNGSPRDPTAFVALVPGVQALQTQAAGTSFASFNGGQPYLNEVYIEGIPTTNAAVQGETRNLSLGVSVEAIDQFQVETNNPKAMYEGQGVENYVLKSGTNQFHGSVYEYFRNTVLDARGFFPATTPVEKQNEFGAHLSGPIKKDKIFFFGSYDGYYFRQGTTPTFQSVPTTLERQGNFSEFPQAIYNPYSTACNSAGSGCARAPFAGNIIPSSLLSPVSQSLQSYLPTPSNSAIQNNFLTGQPIGLHVNNTTDKLDVNLNDKHRFYGFFSRGLYVTDPIAGISAGTNALPLPYTASRIVQEIPTSAQFHDVYVFSPNLLNQFAYSFSRLFVPIISATAGGVYPQKAGLKGLPAGQASLAFPTVNFNGPNTPISWGTTNSIAFDEAINTYVLQDNVQWVHGKHSMTMGGQFQWLQDNFTSPDLGSSASFTFSNTETAGFSPTGTLLTATGNAYASYLLGAVNAASIAQNYVATIGARYKDLALYFQDDFKVNSRLTLNLGLRYDMMGTFHEVADRMSFLNPNLPNPAIGGFPGALQFAGSGPDSCNCATPVPPHFPEYGPRFGLAYKVNDKTVIRGGYALMYAHGGGTSGRGGGRNGTGQLGYNANFSPSSPSNSGTPVFFWSPAAAPLPVVYSSVYAGGVPPYQQPPFFDPTLNTGFCTGCPSAGSITYGDPEIGGKPPYFQNWNFGIQRVITSNMTLTLAYSASNGHFLATSAGRGIWSNQIDPRYLALGSLLTATANPANIAAANAIVPGVHLPYANFSGQIGQMLRPFPQYSGLTDVWGDIGNSTYNSLQAVLTQRLSGGLTFNLAYTRSKELDDVLSSAGRTAYNQSLEKAVGVIDRPNVFSGTFSYRLPFGSGHRWASGNTFVNGLIGNWELSGIFTFSSGPPLTIMASACNAPQTGTQCVPNYNSSFTGPVTINGGMGAGEGNVIAGPGAPATSYIAKNAFVDPPAYTFGNVPRTLPYGLRSPSVWDADLTLRRQFGITERIRLLFALDTFNLFNTVNFGGVSTNIDNASFGQITTQANAPRKLQIDARINF